MAQTFVFVSELEAPSETTEQLRERMRPEVYRVMTASRYEARGDDGEWRRKTFPGSHAAVTLGLLLTAFVIGVLLFSPRLFLEVALVIIIAMVVLRPTLRASVTYEPDGDGSLLRVSGTDERLRDNLEGVGIRNVTSPT